MQAWLNSPGAPFDFAAGVIMMTAWMVSIFYCLAALQGERRDRSILFWKSLPVSDLTIVLSKAAIPLVVLPLITFAIVWASRAIMAVLGSAALVATGGDAAGLMSAATLPQSVVVVLYSLGTSALWMAPVWAWLLLVSGWARRTPILWAAGLPLAPCVVERLGFGSSRLFDLLGGRLLDSGSAAFDAPQAGASFGLAQMAPERFFSDPGMWVGLAIAAAFLAVAVWLRRHRDVD